MIFQNVALHQTKMMVFCKCDNSAYRIDSFNNRTAQMLLMIGKQEARRNKLN